MTTPATSHPAPLPARAWYRPLGFAVLLLLPGAASACGDAEGIDATSVIVKLIAAALFLGVLILMVRNAFASRAPQTPLTLLFPALSALWAAWMGVYLVPRFETLYADFGADLPLQTTLLLDYHYLLALPLILFPFMWYALNGKPRRDGYFAALLAVNVWLTFYVVWALYSPIFKMC